MLPLLKEISKRRKSLNLNQRELAKLAAVSQSLIAKIEAGTINPSYRLAKAIFDVLENLESKEKLRAVDVMSKKVKGVDSHISVSEASSLMSSTGYSQLPVYQKERIIGSITESTIISAILQVGDPNRLSVLSVEEIMNEAFPIVDSATPVTIVSMLLRYSPAVLVTVKGSVKGIITKADLLKMVSG